MNKRTLEKNGAGMKSALLLAAAMLVAVPMTGKTRLTAAPDGSLQEAETEQEGSTKWERMKVRQNAGLLHWELEWREGLTLSEHYDAGKYGRQAYTRSDFHLDGSHALQGALLINIPTRATQELGVSQWTVGAGVGLHRVADWNTLPVYLTARFRPFVRQVPSLFAYADLGCSVLGKGKIYDDPNRGEIQIAELGKSYDTSNFNYGPFGTLGVGYQHMFKRRFGLSLKAGFHLQQFRRQVGIHASPSTETYYSENEDGTRTEYHPLVVDGLYYGKVCIKSLQLGIGLVF